MVEGGDGLGRDDGVALGDEEDAGAEPERRGRGGAGGEGDERVDGAAVLVGQLVVGVGGPRCAPARCR